MTIFDPAMLDRRHQRHDPQAFSATSSGGMIATAHFLATQAGGEVLAAGGNAIDAAVAASLALGVCEPAGSGLGGMTMMMVYLRESGRAFAIEGPCRAPVRATPELVAQSERRSGYRAIAVPTNAAVLGHALRHYGSLPLDVLTQPAIAYAVDGVPITALQHELIHEYATSLTKWQAANRYFDQAGQPVATGHMVRQPELADTLRQLARAGLDDFYCGEVAAEIARDMQANDGFIVAEDLATVPVPPETSPLRGRFCDLDVCTLAPPGGGEALLQMLNLFGALATEPFDADSPAAALLFATIIKRARGDRRIQGRLGRPEGAHALSSPEHTRRIVDELQAELEPGETSHVSVMDAAGNAVSMTQSIERSFGAKVATPTLGFFYNGYMKGFKIQNQLNPHFLRPGAVARSNAGPSILLRDHQAITTIGSTGSERMNSGIFQALVRLRAGAEPFAAVAAPRLHSTPDGEILIEYNRFAPEARDKLVAHGYRLTDVGAWAFKMGGLHLVTRTDSGLVGVAEPRRDGTASGPTPTTR